MTQSGLIIVDKSPGMTSHDVVARVRRIAGTRKVGHAGTLDPMATGVLIVGVERATRLLTYIVGCDKEYHATIRLGQSTITDDAEGETVATADPSLLAPQVLPDGLVATTLTRFVGGIDQIPSAVSAIKVKGVRSYARVRAGESVELAARRVTIERLDLLRLRRSPESIDLDVRLTCSSGTYVRAVARDLGMALGIGGHLTALRRTRVGAFPVEEALTLADLAEIPQPVTVPLSTAAGRVLARREVSADQALVLSHGGPLPACGMSGPYAVFDPEGEFLAVVVEEQGRARPEAVFPRA